MFEYVAWSRDPQATSKGWQTAHLVWHASHIDYQGHIGRRLERPKLQVCSLKPIIDGSVGSCEPEENHGMQPDNSRSITLQSGQDSQQIAILAGYSYFSSLKPRLRLAILLEVAARNP